MACSLAVHFSPFPFLSVGSMQTSQEVCLRLQNNCSLETGHRLEIGFTVSASRYLIQCFLIGLATCTVIPGHTKVGPSLTTVTISPAWKAVPSPRDKPRLPFRRYNPIMLVDCSCYHSSRPHGFTNRCQGFVLHGG